MGPAEELKVPPFDPFSERETVRLSTIYTVENATEALGTSAEPAHDMLRLGRLSPYHEVESAQLPKVLRSVPLQVDALSFRRSTAKCVEARLWLWCVPSGELLTMLTLDLDAPPLSCIGTAEDTYYLDVYLDEQPIAEELAQLVGLNAVHASPILGPDRYQLFFLGNENARTARLPDLLQRLLYRADLPADPQYMAISFPSQMNRRPENAAAVGPYVSALVGQQDYVENVCVLSAIQVLAAMARLRSTRRIAFAAITTLRQLEGQPHLRHERRRELVELSKRLSRLELELSFSVESVQDYSLLVPSLRLDDFHATLCVETRLDRRTQTTSEMVGRLSRALDAELAAMQSADAIMSERRRRTLTSAAGFISFLAIPLGIIFGFFGMAVREVDPTTSMFDFVVYAPLYAFVGGVLLAGGAVALWSWLGLTHRVFGPRPADT